MPPGNGAMAANGEPGITSRDQERSIQMSYEIASAHAAQMPGIPRIDTAGPETEAALQERADARGADAADIAHASHEAAHPAQPHAVPKNPAAALIADSPAETRSPVDFGRLRPGDLIAGIASFVVLISLFFPWYSFAASAAQASATATPAQQQLVLAICSGQPAVCNSNAPPQFSVNALSGVAGGWRFLILVVAITAVLHVLSRTLEGVARAVRSHWQVLVGLTAFQGLLVLIAFFANPLAILDSLGSSSWAAGAFLALIAAIAAVVGAILVMQENKDQRAVSPAPADAARG
jgi:hypothetical protein